MPRVPDVPAVPADFRPFYAQENFSAPMKTSTLGGAIIVHVFFYFPRA
jgi:hypothetical protein